MKNRRWRNRTGSLRGYLAAGLLSVVILLPATANSAATDDEVDAAIDKAVDFLRSRQQKDGSWEVPNPAPGGERGAVAWGGETAIATRALLDAGISPMSADMKRAIEWLAGQDLHGTYAVGLRSQDLSMTTGYVWRENKAILQARDRDRDFLLFSRIQRGPNAGFYGYVYGAALPGGAPGFAPIDPKGPHDGLACDLSNSEFALRGAAALEQAGAEIPQQYWIDEDAAWRKAQLADGGWDYSPTHAIGATYTMTCAGVSALFITQHYLARVDPHQFNTCAGHAPDAEIEKGLAWLDHGQHIAQAFEVHGAPNMYGLYGIACVGTASGRKYFGGIDWYKTGAELIVRSQHADGSWGSIHDTCFAMLFLADGRRPVPFNKLQYELPRSKLLQPWNERPNDIANLANWIGQSLCSQGNWQTTNLAAPLDGMHDASILYISGSEALEFNDSDIVKLRAFIEEGGLILGNADCGSKEFVDSFLKLGTTLFPKYEFCRLPLSHPIFGGQQFRPGKWKAAPDLRAMSNGVRELMIIPPHDDLGRAWQTDSFKTREPSFQLAANIFLYATGKESLSRKLESWIVRPSGTADREIKVARLKAGDNWDPEPGAWRRLSAILHNQRHIDLKPEPVTPGEGKLAGYTIAALTGTTRFDLNLAQRQELKQFVDKGGTLIVDSAGGTAEFADSAEAMLKQTFGDAASEELNHPLPLTHALYTDARTADLMPEDIRYRIYARQFLGRVIHEPRLRGISVAGGRIGVFYSREDITAGLVGEQVDGIIGYDPRVASKLMVSMILYACQNR